MIDGEIKPVLRNADRLGYLSCVEKSRDERLQNGQFFTPPEIAEFLAGWFTVESLNRKVIHLLDPGAGGGALTAAVADRVVALHGAGHLPLLEEIVFEVWEMDEDFLKSLENTLTECCRHMERARVKSSLILKHGNFIEGGVSDLYSDLFSSAPPARVTHAILNPPYRKIASGSHERGLLTSVGIETSNLYSAFVWLALRQLGQSGELVAITPRSFCNGPYFREFRRDLVAKAEFQRVHVFDSRFEAFSRDAVLQENVLYHLKRGTNGMRPVVVTTGSLEKPKTTLVPPDHFVSPEDADLLFHITTENDAGLIRDFFESLPCRLDDLGIEVSTGPVVDFRLTEALSNILSAGYVPLIYPHCLKLGRVMRPASRSEDYVETRKRKKAVAILDNEETRKWLLPCECFVLIKRFSSKEEKRRLVSGVINPVEFIEERLGIENHMNYFHTKRRGLDSNVALGLCRFLNSTVADKYFRHFNGHTQVNASDLRSFRYPDLACLSKLGRVFLDDTVQDEIDSAITTLLGAPTFSSQ